MTHMTLQAVRQLIANDSYAITFQSFGQYRTALLRHFDSLVNQPQGAQAAGEIIDQCMVAMNRHYPLPVTAHTSVAMRAVEDRDAFRKGWVERGLAAIAEKAEAPATEELVHALRQAERLLRAAGFAMNGTASSQIVAAIAAHSAAAQRAAAPGALDDTKRLDMIEAIVHEKGFIYLHNNKPMYGLIGLNVGGGGTFREDLDDLMLRRGFAPSAPGTPEAPQTAAARDVLAERKRQVEVEGWTPAHDDGYMPGALAAAAACYAFPKLAADGNGERAWPFASSWWKPRGPRKDYVRAAALLLAEIERMDRAAQLDTAPEAPKGGA